MTNRIAATILIFICSAIAWVILGSAIEVRTNTASASLNGDVQSIWGTSQTQSPPSATYTVRGAKAAALAAGGTTVKSIDEEQTDIQLPIQASVVNADISVEYRRKGLLWFSTYRGVSRGPIDSRMRLTPAGMLRFASLSLRSKPFTTT
ncbi:MAG TPA: hypothetical protein VGS59_14380 [Candidatus Acidoferrales bacterium]|nr:hypothetical protein [Candidatus Acidoferrales bacterium]